MQDISIRAYNILKKVDVIAGYTTYINLVKDEFCWTKLFMPQV